MLATVGVQSGKRLKNGTARLYVVPLLIEYLWKYGNVCFIRGKRCVHSYARGRAWAYRQNSRCVLQWELSGACAGEGGGGGLKEVAEAVVEEESDGYVLDLRDESDLDRGSDFEAAAEERRKTPVNVCAVSHLEHVHTQCGARGVP